MKTAGKRICRPFFIVILSIITCLVETASADGRKDLAFESQMLIKASTKSHLSALRVQLQLLQEAKNQCEFEKYDSLLPIGCLEEVKLLLKLGVLDKKTAIGRERALVTLCERLAGEQHSPEELRRGIRNTVLIGSKCVIKAKERLQLLAYKAEKIFE